ncbi:MAG: bifunctional diaminohydroxyphosphoribosylaminopyrimidine deaminase/5-amino-6-(5-phosphoribosylamino)uracil reductase RibD [Candidatus Gastranaerophilaceae bacterium]
MDNYEKYMKKCFELACKGAGFVSPNPMVGCVVLDKNGEEIACGYHHKYGENHAERDALLKLDDKQAEGGTLIVNLEPCSHYGKTPPCADLIIEKGIKKVVIAMRDVNPIVAGNGIKKLQNADIEVIEGVLESEAKDLNEIFIKNMTEKKCFVALKTATTLDGKVATKTGSSKWITSEKSRQKGKELRAIYDAVLTTSSTVLADNPEFNCKTKILLDRKLKCALDLKYFKTGKIYIATCIENYPQDTENIKYIQCKEKDNKIDLQDLFLKLFELNIKSVFVEAGGNLNGELIDKDLVDKIYHFIAPKIVGDNSAKSSYEGRDILDINDSKQFDLKSSEIINGDILLVYKANKKGL